MCGTQTAAVLSPCAKCSTAPLWKAKNNPSAAMPLQELGLDMPQGSQDEEGAAQQSLAQVGSPLWPLCMPCHVAPSCPVRHDADVAAMLRTSSLCLAICSLSDSACLATARHAPVPFQKVTQGSSVTATGSDFPHFCL